MPMRIVAAVILAGSLVVSGCTASRSSGTPAVRTSIEALADASDSVLVGVVKSEAGLRNLARNPVDLSQEDPRIVVVAQEYVIEVEEVIKGVGGSPVTLALAKWHGARGEAVGQDAHFIPLRIGARYLLFLQQLRISSSSTAFAQAPEPFRFILTDKAQVESPWGEAATYFPTQAAGVFLSQVRVAAHR